jgi:hypothetical protein
MNPEISTQIKKIFDDNQLEDLKGFLERRKCLNNYNMYLNYLFHFIQSAGILTTTIAAGYDQKYLVWVGISLNIVASLINVYEKTNDNILKKLLKDINAIKDGVYVDESPLIDIDSTTISSNNNNNNNTNNNNSLLVTNPISNTNQNRNTNSLSIPLILDNQTNTHNTNV